MSWGLDKRRIIPGACAQQLTNFVQALARCLSMPTPGERLHRGFARRLVVGLHKQLYHSEESDL
jgi:hypothetical protein